MTDTRPATRWKRWLFIVLAALALLLVLVLGSAYVLLQQALPAERIVPLLAEKVQASTGRSLQIKGSLSVRAYPSIAVVAHDVAFGNAAWGSEPQMATARQAAFRIALRPLFEGRLHILSVELEDFDLLLESDATGRRNWVFERNRPKAPKPPGAAPSVELTRVEITDGRIRYRTAGGVRRYDVQTGSLVADDAQIQVQALLRDGERRWQLKGTIGSFRSLRANQADWPFDLRLATEGADLSFIGTQSPKPAAGPPGSPRPRRLLRVDITARVTRADVLAAWVPRAERLPLPIELSMAFARLPAAMQAERMKLSFPGQTVEGRWRIHTAESPRRFEAELSTAALDLSAWLGPPAERAPATAKAPRTELFGDAPQLRLALPATTLQIKAKADRLKLRSGVELAQVRANVQSNAEGLKIDELSLGVAGGTVEGRVEVKGTEPHVPRVAAQLRARGLSMQALDEMLGLGGHLRAGRAALDLDLRMVGQTPRALVASADGRALLQVSDTAVNSGAPAVETRPLIAVLNALLPGSHKSGTPAIECAVVYLPLQDGIATIDRSVAIETDQLAIAAVGELNLRNQTVSLNFRPAVKKGVVGLDPAQLAQLVRLEGPLVKPQVGVDLAGTARQAVSAGVTVATGGLSLLAERLLRSPETTQACKHAAAAADTNRP